MREIDPKETTRAYAYGTGASREKKTKDILTDKEE